MTPADDLNDADDPATWVCLPCAVGACDACLYLTRPTSCTCDCQWLYPEGAT